MMYYVTKEIRMGSTCCSWGWVRDIDPVLAAVLAGGRGRSGGRSDTWGSDWNWSTAIKEIYSSDVII